MSIVFSYFGGSRLGGRTGGDAMGQRWHAGVFKYWTMELSETEAMSSTNKEKNNLSVVPRLGTLMKEDWDQKKRKKILQKEDFYSKFRDKRQINLDHLSTLVTCQKVFCRTTSESKL